MVLTVLGVASGVILWAGNLQGDVRVNETRIENSEKVVAELKSEQREIKDQVNDLTLLMKVYMKDRGYDIERILATSTMTKI